MRGYRRYAAVAAAAAAAIAGVAMAHGGGSDHAMGGHGMMGMGGQGMGGMMGAGVAGLDALKTELNLRPEQSAAWEGYASTVRNQAEARRKMREGMHSGTVDHRAMHETMSAYNRQAATELAAAQKSLYDVLTPEQRSVADRTLTRPIAASGGGRHQHH